jgi:YD repeat-containing protein
MPLSIKRRLTLAASVSLLFFLGGELPGSAQQAASFTYDQRGRLTVFVAPDGTITKYVYDAAGNISSIQRGTAADLMRIDSVTPNTGVVPGNTLTIVGQNFDPVASNNTVLFAEVSGSVPALVTGASATQLTVQVPQGAVTGAIRVQRLGQTVTGPVVTIQNLAIASISPTTPVVSGSTITLTGQGFSLNANGNTISFFGAGGTSIPVTVTTADPTQLSLQVPAGAVSGLISVSSGTQSITGPNVQIQTLTISGVTPAGPYLPGATITLAGQGFSLLPSGNIVTFAGANGTTIPVPVTTSNPASLTLQIPQTAVSGALSISVAPQTVTGPNIQLQTLQITSISPNTPVVSGTRITINGQGFNADIGGNAVRFAGVNGTTISVNPITASSTQLIVDVPSGVVSGNVAVTGGGQTATGPILQIQTLQVTGSTPVGPYVPGAVFTLTLTGQGFSLIANDNTVVFPGANGTTIPVTASSNSNQLTVQVPSGATSGIITVTVGGQTAQEPSLYFLAPRITSISPSSPVVPASILTISGQDFNTNGTNLVSFAGNVSVPVITTNPNQLTVQVPLYALTGAISISVGTATTIGPVVNIIPLAITSVQPNTGVQIYSSVTITGQGFPAVPLLNYSPTFNVSFKSGSGEVSANNNNITQYSSTQMTVQVPPAAVSGPVIIRVGPQSAVSSSIDIAGFQVDTVTPNTNLTPKQILTIAGQGFATDFPTDNQVNFTQNPGSLASSQAYVLSATSTLLTVEAPIDFAAGPIEITAKGLVVNTPDIAPVPLVVNSVSPNIGVVPGQTVLITGQGFNPYLSDGQIAPVAELPGRVLVASTDLRLAASTIFLPPVGVFLTKVFFSDCQGGLVEGTVQGATSTQLRVLVPNGTCSGPVTVQALGQTATGPSITSQSSSNSVQIVEVPMPAKMVSFSESVERAGK